MELSEMKWIDFKSTVPKSDFEGDWESRTSNSVLENGKYIVEEIFFHNEICYGFINVHFNKVISTYNFSYENALRIARIS